MTDNLKRAIGVLKDYRKGDYVDDTDLCEAIDTVLSSKNTEKKTGLDENLLEKGIDQPDNQDVLSYKKDRIYTAEDMKAFADWSYKQSYRMMWNEGKYIGYSGMLELWEQQRKEATV